MKSLRPAFAPTLLGVLLAAIAPATAQTPNTLLHSLFDTNPPASQRGVVLGWSVAVEGNTIVAGGPGPPARVNVFDAATGALRHSLTNPNPAGYGFGRSVAVSGSRVAVGAFEDYVPGVGSVGRAYIYDLASSTPTVLTNPSPAR